MTQADKTEVRLLLDFATPSPKLEKLKAMYVRDFHRLSDIDRFIEGVGGIDNALEVLGIYECKR